ncbi:hypothetical protein V1477_000181 [Vespula maculifrons]|uniref:Uncharacterized protein n=1 Tax=Vespula maculifrons TaxID=7453 RepID=A0ABD2D3G6_VESMC
MLYEYYIFNIEVLFCKDCNIDKLIDVINHQVFIINTKAITLQPYTVHFTITYRHAGQISAFECEWRIYRNGVGVSHKHWTRLKS